MEFVTAASSSASSRRYSARPSSASARPAAASGYSGAAWSAYQGWGAYCAGKAGVDLSQAFIALNYSAMAGDPHGIEEAVNEFVIARRHLRDEATGLTMSLLRLCESIAALVGHSIGEIAAAYAAGEGGGA